MNTALLTRPTRPHSRGLLLKTAVVVPDVIISSLIGLVSIAALPPAGGFGVIVVWVAVAVVLAAGLAEDPAVRILYGARRPTPTEASRLGVPWRIVTTRVVTDGVQLLIVSHEAPVATAGRRHVLLAHDVVDAYRAGQLTDGEVAALVVHGMGHLHHGHTLFELLWVFWTWPWDFLRGLVVRVGRRFAWVPLVQFAWQIRVVVGSIAVVLEAQAGRWPSPIIIATFIALSYLMPRWGRAWDKQLTDAADRYTARVGLGDDLARFLGRVPRSSAVADRIDRLPTSVSHIAH